MTAPRRATMTISDLAACANKADDLRGMLSDGVKQLADDAKNAQLAADRFRASAEKYRRLERQLWDTMTDLATDLHDMKLHYERRKAGRA